jgi:hypothetical protein
VVGDAEIRRARVLRNVRALVYTDRLLPRDAARRLLALHGLTLDDMDREPSSTA